MHETVKSLLMQFAVYSCADLLAFSALNFTLNLQSSINVEDGLGTKALAATFSSAILFGLLTTPLILRKLGPKIGLVISASMITIFISSNYYPAYATMMPAAIMLGLSEGTIWPSIILMNFYFGNEYSKLRNKPEKSQHYINIFSGCFFTVHHLNQVIGGMAGYFLLGRNSEEESTLDQHENQTEYYATADNESLAFCGSNDCQIDSELNEVITNYTPTDRYKLIIMLSLFVAMCIVATILNACCLPNPRKKHREAIRLTTTDRECKLNDKENQQATLTCTVEISTEDGDISTKFVEKPTKQKVVKGITGNVLYSVRGIFKQFLRPKQLLILPITFYHGLLTTFILSEFPRAYVSCVKGYTSISLYSCVFGIAHLSSCIVGKFTKKIGHPYLLTIAMILDIANLTFCLLWKPDIDTSWMIYLSYFMFGMTDGTWQLSLNLTHVVFFPETREEAGSVWVTVLNLGLAVQFAWSTALCQYVKIYVMIGTLVVGVVMFYAAEHLHKKERNL